MNQNNNQLVEDLELAKQEIVNLKEQLSIKKHGKALSADFSFTDSGVLMTVHNHNATFEEVENALIKMREESWDDIFQEYSEYEETGEGNIYDGGKFKRWIKENYNPPTRKS